MLRWVLLNCLPQGTAGIAGAEGNTLSSQADKSAKDPALHSEGAARYKNASQRFAF